MADRRLLHSTAVGSALAALALFAQPALAQYASYNIEVAQVVSGAVEISSTQTADTFTIFSPTAVIDLFALDFSQPGQPFQFQNPNTSAIYQGTTDSGDFVVLNRIVTETRDRPALFSGNVISRLDAGTGAPRPGGTVWFYSPGGIVIGEGAVFDVGNLLLSTADPTGGSGIITSRNVLNLASAQGSSAGVLIEPGATITAANPGSYIALVAPAVTQNGTVNVNGSAAYVAAENATLNFSQGLFDISVAVGSDAPLFHGGTTRFLSTATPSRAYLVSVPKNEAATLVLGAGADIGFDIATTVGVDNGVIVLGSGFQNIAATPDATSLSGGFTNPGGQIADISVGSGTFNANFVARARDNAEIIVNGEAQFTNNVSLRGGASAVVYADEGALSVGGNLLISAVSPPVDSEASRTGGSANLSAINGGSVAIGGNLRVDASAIGPLPGVAGAVGAAAGGSATVSADGGTIDVGGNATLAATAGSTTLATGGGASLLVTSAFRAGGGLTLDTLAVGQAEAPATGGSSGGSAVGGVASIVSSGTLQVGQNLTMSALAIGGDKVTSLTGSAGNATGGTARLLVLGGTTTVAGATGITTRAQGGANPVAGNGGNATAGATTVEAGLNGVLGLTTLAIDARAQGGAAVNGNGGDATGAINAVATASGGQITATALTLNVGATGGAGVTGGRGAGAVTTVSAGNRGLIATTGALTVNADAVGGAGSNGGSGGNAVAAPVVVLAATGGTLDQGSRIEAGSASLSASATGGAGGAGTTTGGRGGDATAAGTVFIAEAGNGVVQSGGTTLTARATGGAGGAGGTTGGAGGNATSGFGSVGTAPGPDTPFTAGSASYGGSQITATSIGGAGGTGSTTGGAGGNATSLAANAFSNGAPVTFGNLSLTVAATAGSGGTNTAGARAAAGVAQAGTINLVAQVRPNRPDRGSIVAGQINGNMIPTAGLGPNNAGGQRTAGTLNLRVVDADLTAGGTLLQAIDPATGTPSAPTTLSSITVANGTLAGGNNFFASLVGDVRMSLYNGGALSATGAIAIDTPATITFLPRPTGATSDGTIAAPTMQFFSGDFDLGPTMTIGNSSVVSLLLGTQRLDTAATLGGTGQGPGYTLDQAEVSRLRGANIGFQQGAPGTVSPNSSVVVRDLTVVGSEGGAQANITSGTGTFSITGAGSMRVNGNVRLSSAAAGNNLLLSTPGNFELVTDTGSVGVFATGGALGGRLSINANAITVADQALFGAAQTLGLADFGAGTLDATRLAALVAAINKPSLVVKPEGSLQGGRIELAARDYIVIQNSGTTTAAGGFSTGTAGLSVTSRPRTAGLANAPFGLAIDGRILGADGIFLNDIQTVSAVTLASQREAIDPLDTFSTASTINSCPLRGPCLRSGETDIIRINQVVGDLIDDLVTQTVGEITGAQVAPLFDAIPLDQKPLIDEPVTGSGNPSLWQTPPPKPADSGEAL